MTASNALYSWEKSKWWWVHTLVTVAVFTPLLSWLLVFVLAATDEVRISDFELLEPSRAETGAAPPALPGFQRRTKRFPEINTLSLLAGDFVRLKALTSPASHQMRAPTLNALHWVVLRRYDELRWRLDPNWIRTEASAVSFSHTFTEPGEYLVAAAFPPVRLRDFDGKRSDYISAFLEARHADRARFMSFVISPKPSLEQPLIEKKTIPATQTDISSVHTPPNNVPEIGKNHEVTPDPNNITDLSVRQEGAPLPGARLRSAQIPRRRQVASDSITLEETKNLRTDGVLPPIEIEYYKEQLAALTEDQCLSLLRRYSMPFVLVPREAFSDEFEKWPVMLPSGRRQDMERALVRRTYGFYILPLREFSQNVQDRMSDMFDDPTTYYKCSAYRGFLLGSVLLQAVQESLANANIAVSKIDTVTKITVSLKIERDATGEIRLITTPKDVELLE